MKENPLVIYHGNCMDGFTAAWACWLKHPEWEFYAATHGNPPPPQSLRKRDVYLLDFSYKLVPLLKLASYARQVTILDHHQSAERDLKEVRAENLTVIFDMDRSGAMLAWNFFHPNTIAPKFVQIVEDRDLWRFELAETRPISAAIFSYPYDFEVWNQLNQRCEESISSLASDGAAIERKHHKDVAELVGVCRSRIGLGGYNVPVANLPYTLASDAGHLLLAEGDPFAATYYDTETHRVYSLRSAEGGADVSEVARLYGGGGHKHAAGFRLPLSEVLR